MTFSKRQSMTIVVRGIRDHALGSMRRDGQHRLTVGSLWIHAGPSIGTYIILWHCYVQMSFFYGWADACIYRYQLLLANLRLYLLLGPTYGTTRCTGPLDLKVAAIRDIKRLRHAAGIVDVFQLTN